MPLSRPIGRLRRRCRRTRVASARLGFTLMELMLVVGIVSVLAGLLLVRGDELLGPSQERVTEASMSVVRDAICGDRDGSGFLSDLGELPARVAQLFEPTAVLPSGAPVLPFDPFRGKGWNGPYLARPTGTYVLDVRKGFGAVYGEPGDPALLDAWRAAIVLQWPSADLGSRQERQGFVRLVSAGPDGLLETSPSLLQPNPADIDQVGDDLVLYLFRASSP